MQQESPVSCPIGNVKLVPIYVDDQERALEFWRDLVGFHVQTDAIWGDERWIELLVPEGETNLALVLPGDDLPEDIVGNGPPHVFATGDVDRAYELLASRGVPFDGPPVSAPSGTTATFRDPDGNRYVLASSDSSD